MKTRIQMIIPALALGMALTLLAPHMAAALRATDSPTPSGQTDTDMSAETPPSLLSLPIDCTVGEDCWVVNYLDHDMTKKVRDLRCNMRSYDDHKGIDIALPDRVTMFSNIAVLAPADATVVDTRNTVADHKGLKDDLIAARESGKECGNKVALHLGNNWFVELCHLKQGSVTVKTGDTVKRGDKLATVGMSGLTSFAHLHVGVKHGNTYIDPLTGETLGSECTPYGADLPGKPLFEAESGVTYSPTDLYAAGFANDRPVYLQIKESAFSPSTLPRESQIFTFWTTVFGLAPGDMLHLVIRDPRGRIFAENQQKHPRHSAQYMYFVGKKTTNDPLMPGTYTGETTLTRTLPDGSMIKKHITKKVKVR